MKKINKSILAFACVACLTFSVGCKPQDVPVEIPFEFSLSRECMDVEAGTGMQISLTLRGSNEKPVWTSSDERVATVNENGFVYGVSSGTAIITATVNGVSQSCTVIVSGVSYAPVLTLSHDSVRVFVGGTVTASGYVTSNLEIVDDVEITWTSSNESVVTVDDGVISGVAEGSATILARAEYNQTILEKSISVQVKKSETFFINESDVRLAVTAINANDITTMQLSTTAQSFSNNGASALNGDVEWVSSDDSIVSVDENGQITSNKKGVATITANLKVDGEVKYTAWTQVEVYKSAVSGVVELGENGEIDLSKGDFTFAVSELVAGGLGYEVEKDDLVISQDKWVYDVVSVSNGNITIDNDSIAWGERTFTVELKDRIVTGKTLAITKVLRTVTDVQNITQLSGGRDEKSQAYAGYFVLANSIDLGDAVIGAELDAPIITNGVEKADQNLVITRGFQGVFDGRGYALIGGKYKNAGGLFGTVGNAGSIKNVALINANLASIESVGAGLFAQKFYGSMEDVSVSCVMTGNYVSNATIATWATGASFKNVVAETVYEGTRGEDSANYGFIAQIKGSDTKFNNVYAITDLANGTAVKAIGAGSYEEIGNGFVGYNFNDEAKYNFIGFNTGVWAEYEAGEIPVFQAEKDAGYTTYRVEHHREFVTPQLNTAGEIETIVSRYNLRTDFDVARYHAIAGTSVTATAKVLDGYKANEKLAGTKMSGVAGELTNDNCLKVVYSLTKDVTFNGAREETYSVNYYLENESTGEYEWVVSMTETYTVKEGTYCKAKLDVIPEGYYADTSVIGSIESGIITRSQNELKVYAKVAVPVANTDGKGYIYPLANDADCGSKDFETTSIGTFEGQANAYKLDFESKLRFRIVGVDNAYVEENGYTKFTFKLYMENPVQTNYAIYLYDKDTKAVKSAFSLHMSKEVLANINYVHLIDSNGYYISSARSGEWFTVEINIENIQSRAQGLKRLHVEMQCNGDSTVYISDAQFIKGEWEQDATYTVEHYKQTATGYVLDESLTETYSEKVGTMVTATYKDVDGYLPFSASATVSSGMVSPNAFALKLYYNEAVKVANTENKGYLYPLAGDANYGARELTIEKQSQAIAGVNDAYKLTSTSATVSRIVGVDNAYAKTNGYQTFKFWIYVESFDVNNRPYIKLSNVSGSYESNVARLTVQNYMKSAENYVRIYNEDGVRMATVVAKQWCVVEVDITNVGSRNAGVERMHVELHTETNSSYSYYIANATLSTDAFNKADSPLAVTYKGERVGAMVSYQAQRGDGKGVGNSGLISSEYGMRLTQTAVAGKDCVKVDMCSAGTRNTWLMLKGLSSADITSKGITKITFDYYIDGTTNNPLIRMYDTSVSTKFYISPNAQTDTLVKVNGEQAKVTSGTWCSVEITLSNASMTVGDWRGSLWAGLDLQLGADSGSFYVANFVLS